MASAPLPPARGLIDTSVLLAEPDAVGFVRAVRVGGKPEVSQITVLAMFARCQDAPDVAAVRTPLGFLTVHGVTAHTTRRAQRLLESLPPPAGLTADDAIVAATAIEHSLPLYTLDPGRFAVPGRATLRPY